MLDEPSANLPPVLADHVLAVMDAPRQRGTAVLLMEQLIEMTLRVADRLYGLAQGRVVLRAAAAEADRPHRQEQACFGEDTVAPLDAGR
jgi:branched-chain amino acid transport system ATP-binding protein